MRAKSRCPPRFLEYDALIFLHSNGLRGRSLRPAAGTGFVMPSLSPIVIALAIVSVLAFIGAVLSIYRRSILFSGYKDLSRDAQEIARTFRGDIYRDANDLVISGNMNKLPVFVRFSQDENTPGLFIRMEMPALFQMTIVPQGSSQQAEGKAVVRLGDKQFDNKFTTRTDQPNQFRMLLGPRVIANVQKLCCSNRTFLSVERGVMELTELAIPGSYVGRHVNEHLREMAEIAKEMGEIPGAHEIKIKPIERERNVVARGAMAVGVIAAIATVATGYSQHQQLPVIALAAETTPGIEPADARRIPGAQDWRLVKPADDFDPSGLTWAQNSNLSLAGHMKVDLSGTGDGRDDVYVLRSKKGMFRIVLLSRDVSRYDINYDKIAVVAPFPKQAVESTDWVGGAPENPDGDGVLIASDPGNPAHTVVIFLKGNRIVSGQPAHYENIHY
jgi:hypothetical protein